MAWRGVRRQPVGSRRKNMDYEPVNADESDIWQHLSLPDIVPNIGGEASHERSDALTEASHERSDALTPVHAAASSATAAVSVPRQLTLDVKVVAHQQQPEQAPVVARDKDFRCQLQLSQCEEVTAVSVAGSADVLPPQTVRFRISVALQSAVSAGTAPRQPTPIVQLHVASAHPPLLLLRGITELDVPVNGEPVTTMLRMGHDVTSFHYRHHAGGGALTWQPLVDGGESSTDGSREGARDGSRHDLAQFCLLIEPVEASVAAAHPGLAQFTQPAFQVVSRVRRARSTARNPREDGESSESSGSASASARLRLLSLSASEMPAPRGHDRAHAGLRTHAKPVSPANSPASVLPEPEPCCDGDRDERPATKLRPAGSAPADAELDAESPWSAPWPVMHERGCLQRIVSFLLG